MLSRQMTFSLMRLITLLAFAFVVPSAVADFFWVTIEGRKEVTYTDGKQPVEVKLIIKTEQPVSDFNLTLLALTKEGLTASGPTIILDGDFPDESARLHRFTLSVTPELGDGSRNNPISKVIITVPALTTPDTTVENGMSEKKQHIVTFTRIEPNRDRPTVVSIQRLRFSSQTVTSAFQEAAVTGPFEVRIVLSEQPHDFDKFINKINVANGTKSGFVRGAPFAWEGGRDNNNPVQGQAINPHPIEGKYNHDGVITTDFGDTETVYGPLVGIPEGLDEMKVPLPTGPDGMYYQCRVTITPRHGADSVTISIKEFHDGDAPRNYYYPIDVENKPNGREQLRLTVGTLITAPSAGFPLYLPHANAAQIPYANGTPGHYILTRDKDGSGIDYSEEVDALNKEKVENIAQKQTPAQLLYNVRASVNLPNLEGFLANSGTIDLVAYDGTVPGAAYISEVMWGSDASLDIVTKSQWIEIANATHRVIGIGKETWVLWFYQAHETPVDRYVKEDGTVGTLIDRIGTKASVTGLGWSIAGKGQSGRTNVDVVRATGRAIAPTRRLISMYRVIDETTGRPADGTRSRSWMASTPPSVNFRLGLEGTRDASPGSRRVITAEERRRLDAAAAKAADTSVRIPEDGQIYISEIMFAGGGSLPQWIEITNGSRTEQVNLSGWTLKVENATADADVSVGAEAVFTIPEGTRIDPSGQHDTPSTILVVTEVGRNNLDAGPGGKGRDQVLNLWADQRDELILLDVTQRRYSLLSDIAFEITLASPAQNEVDASARPAATDRVGNLAADGTAAWELPMSEEGRSSIIRRHVQVFVGPAAPLRGTRVENWVLASETAFADRTHIRAKNYYGAANDVGTPGFRVGGALPVELSHFRPVRDKATGAVVITWSTQSELNNAGFFIKRSQQKDGQFKVINATMIAGAGTTSEKQFYTYTDTTAQPNVVYYYQIEDVSLDGNRQTLTRGIRLKGHVGAAGKATMLWGELKTQE